MAPVKGVEGFNRASPVSGPTYVDATERGKAAAARGAALDRRGTRPSRPRPIAFAAGTTDRGGTRGWRIIPARHGPSATLGRERMAEAVRAEQLVTVRTKRGFARLEWQKLRERNEALDTRVYARAAAWILGADRWSDARWTDLEAQVGITAEDMAEDGAGNTTPASRRAGPQRRTVRSSYMR